MPARNGRQSRDGRRPPARRFRTTDLRRLEDRWRSIRSRPGRSVTYDAARLKLNEAPLAPVDGRIRIQVLADRSLTEIIGNDGRVFITAVGKPAPGGGMVSVTAQGGAARLVSLEAHELKSIWQAR